MATKFEMGQLVRIIKGPDTGKEGYVQNGWGAGGGSSPLALLIGRMFVRGVEPKGLWVLPKYVEEAAQATILGHRCLAHEGMEDAGQCLCCEAVQVADLTDRLNTALDALDRLQLTAFDAAVNSIPEAHVTLRQEMESACAEARDVTKANQELPAASQ